MGYVPIAQQSGNQSKSESCPLQPQGTPAGSLDGPCQRSKFEQTGAQLLSAQGRRSSAKDDCGEILGCHPLARAIRRHPIVLVPCVGAVHMWLHSKVSSMIKLFQRL